MTQKIEFNEGLLGDYPRFQHTVHLQPEIIMQMCCMMLMKYELRHMSSLIPGFQTLIGLIASAELYFGELTLGETSYISISFDG